jgi:hypothetical protein
MEYPLHMTFKLIALSPQIKVTDSAGETVCYVKQKMFKLKEAVQVFRDESQQQKLCDIKADRIIDFSACYRFYDTSGESFGSVKRHGMRSIWKAHYMLMDENDQQIASIHEENPLTKMMDSLFGEIPLVGMFSGYMFHPKYLMTTMHDQPMIQLEKQPAMWEGKYRVDKLANLDPVDELRSLMGFLMMALLERRRG